MNKYDRLIAELAEVGTGSMKCAGNSMLPILQNPSTCTYQVQEEYEIGDIVFCKVKGRYIDAHIITAKDKERYMISNNSGHQNGWTKTIYGKVVLSEDKHGILKEH